MINPTESQFVAAFVSDVTPQSPYHWLRIFCGGFMGLLGAVVLLGELFVLREHPGLLDVILTLSLIGGGAAVVFTQTMMAVLQGAGRLIERIRGKKDG